MVEDDPSPTEMLTEMPPPEDRDVEETDWDVLDPTSNDVPVTEVDIGWTVTD